MSKRQVFLLYGLDELEEFVEKQTNTDHTNLRLGVGVCNINRHAYLYAWRVN